MNRNAKYNRYEKYYNNTTEVANSNGLYTSVLVPINELCLVLNSEKNKRVK